MPRATFSLCAASWKKSTLIDLAWAIVSLGLVLWAYAPALFIPLWGDDAWHIYTLRNSAHALRLLYDPAVALEVNWSWVRPLGFLSFTLDYQLWRLNPFGYHLHNLILHSLTLLMLVWFLREFFSARLGHQIPQPFIVWPIALVFALNPIAAQPVIRPNMRFDLYAALLTVSSLLAFLRWELVMRGRMLAVGLAFCAFASKDSAMALLPPSAALVSAGLMKKVEEGRARIFTYQGEAWRDTTVETIKAMRAKWAASKGPQPMLTAAVDGYRVRVNLKGDLPAWALPGVSVHRP